MLVKGWLGPFPRPSDGYLLLAGYQAGGLLPKYRNRAADLGVREDDAGRAPKYRLGLDKVGNVAVIVDASRVDARTGSSARKARYDAEIRRHPGPRRPQG